MNIETPFTAVASFVFDGENYQIWAIKMVAFLEANDLWDPIEEDYEIPPLAGNPTIVYVKSHKDKKQRKSKAKTYLFSTVTPTIFTRIMSLKSVKAIWDFLKKEYEMMRESKE